MSFKVNSAQLSEANFQRLRVYCMDAQARRNHSQHELITKMTRRGADEQLAHEVVHHLTQERLQSDEDFIESKLNSALRQGHGPSRLFKELGQHKLDSELVQHILNTHEPDWYELAKHVYLKKYSQGISPTLSFEEQHKEKAKRARFLYGRGFSSDQIQYALESSN